MSTPQAIPGDPWVICDICGVRFRLSQTKKTWNGLRTCAADWDPKHPQLDLHSKVDRQTVIDGRPEAADQFLDPELNPVTIQTLFPGCYED